VLAGLRVVYFKLFGVRLWREPVGLFEADQAFLV